jgi:large subunit ribosomal protein L22
MSKASTPRALADNQALATLRGIKGSQAKAQLVMDLIRGKPIERALNDLTFSRKKMALLAKKLLVSAVANAANNHNLNIDKLVVSAAYADKATMLKRWNPRARGRAAPIQKSRCHLTIVVAEKEAAPKAVKAPKAAPKAEAKEQPAETTEA